MIFTEFVFTRKLNNCKGKRKAASKKPVKIGHLLNQSARPQPYLSEESYLHVFKCNSPPTIAFPKPGVYIISAAHRRGYVSPSPRSDQGIKKRFAYSRLAPLLHRTEHEIIYRALNEARSNDQRVAVLHGERGSGTTTGLTNYAATVDRSECRIIWLNFKSPRPTLTIDDGKNKYVYLMKNNSVPRISPSTCNQTIVILDGDIPNEIRSSPLQYFPNATQIIMSGSMKQRHPHGLELVLVAWKKHECVKYILHEYTQEFRGKILKFFGLPKKTSNKRLVSQKVEQRYRVTGGNCRLLFEGDNIDWAEVFRFLPPSEIANFYCFRDDGSPNVPVNLFSRRRIDPAEPGKPTMENTETRFNSVATLTEVMELLNLTIVHHQFGESHPTIRGIHFEDKFIAYMSQQGNQQTVFETREGGPITLNKVNEVALYDNESILKISHVTFLYPQNKNNAGFDATLIDSNSSELVFFQVTTGEWHDFKLENFITFFERYLEQNEVTRDKIHYVMICFVCDEENFEDFTHAEPSLPLEELHHNVDVFVTRFPYSYNVTGM